VSTQRDKQLVIRVNAKSRSCPRSTLRITRAKSCRITSTRDHIDARHRNAETPRHSVRDIERHGVKSVHAPGAARVDKLRGSHFPAANRTILELVAPIHLVRERCHER
jgi:hypothetical protein